MVQYCGRFIPKLADISAPLRALTHKDAKWTWGPRQKQAFENLKHVLTTETTMAYFDSSKNTELYVDASPFGLGAILTQTTPGQQDTKVIAYASRSLTDTESRYSQIERESLAIVYGIEHFHIYLYGHEFTLITDHNLLELIYRNPKSRPSARLERWCLRLQDYTFQVKYRPGPANPSDYLSRHPLTTRPDNKQQNLSDEHVRFVVNHAVPVALDVNTIRRATQDDPTCQKLIELLQNNSWNSLNTNNLHPEINTAELRAYELLKQELSLTPEADLIIRGNRLVIPTKLRQQVISLAHEGHQGLIKTKKLLREKVWFPKIDTLTEKAVKECLACQSVGQPSKPAPIQPMPIPQQAWDVVYVDFLGPLPTKDLLLVIIDGRTRYPEVEIVRNTSAKSTIQCFENIFSRHGIPRTIVSDNGPPFQGDEIRQYQTAVVEHKDWKLELQRFLLNYRATPHCTTKVPPATALFRRNIRTKLPEKSSKVNMEEIDKKINEADASAKAKQKVYADHRRGATTPIFKVGDQVLVRQRKRNKLTSRFDCRPYKIVAIKGTMITARRNDHHITRNCSHFKPFSGTLRETNTESDLESDESDDTMPGNEEVRVEADERLEGRDDTADRRERRYLVRRRNRPLFYRDEQNVRQIRCSRYT